MSGFVGENCDILCINPDLSDTKKCVCANGYYGTKCDQTCPGGVDHPCSGHGVCDAVWGKCYCSISYAGPECSVCAEGYFGADCSVAVKGGTSSNKLLSTAYLSSNSYLKTPDGAYLQVNNKDYPTELYNDGTIKIEAQKGPTDKYQSGVKAVGISVGGQNLTIYPTNSGTVKVNGQTEPLGSIEMTDGYTVYKTSKETITVSGPDNFEMKTPISEDSLNVQLEVSKSACKTASGLFGCKTTGVVSSCPQNDISCIIEAVGIAKAAKNHNISEDDINKYFLNSSKLYDESIFAGAGETQVTAGTALKIGGGGSVTLPTIDDGMLDSTDTKDFSLESRIKFETKSDGTVLSIANDNATLGIILKNNYYSVKYGEHEYPTNVPVVTDEWTNVGLSFDQETGEAIFHEIHEGGNTIYKQINMSEAITEYGPPIEEGSSPVVGKWQTSNLTQTNPTDPPEGENPPIFAVDRLLVWPKYNNITDYENNFKSNIDNSTFTKLPGPRTLSSSYVFSSNTTGTTNDTINGAGSDSTKNESSSTGSDELVKPIIGFNFDEGFGTAITDFCGGLPGMLGFDGEYEYIDSDPPISTKGVPEQRSNDIIPAAVDLTVNETCNMMTEALEAVCDKTLVETMYKSCLNDATMSGSPDNSIDSVITAASLCQAEEGLSDFCNSFGAIYAYNGVNECDMECPFGNIESGICICLDGYWGITCQNECPGGHTNPCHGHGDCNVTTGLCQCEQEWNGDPKCSSCSEYFSGSDCDMFDSDPTVGELTTTLKPAFTTEAGGNNSTGGEGGTAGDGTGGDGSTGGGGTGGDGGTGGTGDNRNVTTVSPGNSTDGNSGTGGNSGAGGSGGSGGNSNNNGDGSTTSLPVGERGVCSLKGKGGQIKMFNTKGKKITSTYDKAILLEMNNFKILIRQNKLKKKKKTLLAIDKIFITYKDKIVNFELEQGTSKRGKKSKKPQSKISVGEKSLGVWKKKTKVDESLGDIVMKTINAKTISVEVDMLGFKLEVTRGSIFFKLKLIIDNKLRDHSGLCKWVPSSITDIPYGEYESYSLPEPLSDAQSGTDTEVGKDFSSSDYFDISNVAGKESGYALCCSDASVNAKQFQLFNDDELTVSFYLKSCPDCYGVVFSYKANNEVPISLDNMKNGLEISYGKKKTYRSDIQLEKNVWHFIALTWSKRLKEINLYVIAENKPSNPKTFKIEKFVGKPFLKGGALSLGKFQISGQEKKWKKPNEFVGCYDSLGFAYIALTLTQVQSLYSKSPSSVKSYLGSSNFYYYDFDEDPYESNGYLENDLSDGEIEGLFKGMASQFKIENKKPLNNCYQRTSDAPITDSSIEQTYNVKSARRRRSLQLDDREITHVLRFAANKMDRVRRATVTYDYNALCDRVFTSTSSSSLASTCSETVMLPTRSVALWECYDANGDGDDIADAIGGFASDCETTLGLNYFPATETCREFEDDFNLYPYMGEVCSPNCSFGGIESSSSQCKCDDGYWDSSCSSVCPGGATNPCNGFDTCDQVTGECRCPINMQGSDNCTICSPGWYGDDCEITDNEAESGLNTSLALLGQLGNVYTLDGLTYPIKTQGELLLLAISDNIVIQGKFITCYTNYSCTPFISARIGDSSNGFATITVQSSIYYNEKPYVYINEVQTVLDTAAFFRGFKIYRSNFFEVTIDVKDIILFTVRTVGQYLHLSTKMDNLIVSKTSGLLSGGLHTDTVAKMDHLYNSSYTEFAICNDTALSQSVLGSESSNVLALTSYTQAFGNDLTFSTTRFEVTECDCVIYYPEAGFKNQTVGGYSLSFSKSSIHHENFEIDTSLYSELTFEIQVKTDTGNDSGVLFAFTSDMGFAMISGSTSLEIHTFIDNNHTIHDTELSMDASDWNKIVFTYDTATGESYVYVIYGNGATSSTGSFELPSTIFNSPGTLSVGQWQAPSSASQYLFQNGFEGDLENFMIWSLIIEESQISQLHQMNPALASAMLIYSLQFNEGNGDTTMDSISSSNLKLPTYPWKAPEWKVSDLVYTSDDLSYLAFSFFTDKTLQSEANDLCGNALFDTNCVGMSNATLEVFYIECMQAISATKDLTSGYNAVLDAYTICESQNTFSSSEIVTFCASLDDEDRNGTSCTTSCPFGTVFANGTCSCFNGYYGTQCDSVCPGSSDSPCNDHGECQTDGACDCWWNWNGDSSCSSCSSDSNGDMTGPDCIILETTSLSSSSSKIGAVSSNGYFMTFDGQQISFVGETGAFILFSSSTLGVDIHVYQVGCSYGSCVAALSLESATTSVVIAPPGSGYAPIVYKNGEQITLDDTTVSIDNYITVSQDSLTDISVSITTLGTITVKVVVQEEFLQASVYTAPTVCQSATGILGACGSGTDYKTMTEAEIVEYIVDNFRLSSSVIFDALNAPVGNGTTITGYAIKFNKNSVMTKPLAYPSGFSLNELDFSLSLYWKPSSYGGFIVSYGKDIAFTIINTSPLKLQCQETVLETAVIPELDVWNQLVLTFRQQNGTIDLFHFGADSKITNEVLTFECMGLFEEGGTVMLGEYMPATESAYTYNTDFFVGVIDEVSVWKNPIPNTLIYQAHLLSTKVSGFTSELSQLISFTEGVGTVAYDEINGNNLILPNSPWQSPEWFVSDLGLQDLRSIDSSRYSTNNIDSEVEALCSVFFDDSAVTSDCSRVSSFIVWWYKQNCMITATLSGNVTDVTMSMVDYTSVCEVTGGSTDSLYDIICNLGIITQGWLNQKCSGCLFGYKEDGNCICYHGYYGTTCESVCPGGAATPCSGNGVCDNSGACQCSGRFDGTECNTCLTGWTGDECTIMKQAGFDPMNSVNTTILVAQVNLLGQLAMFDGAVVDMPLSGYYELMALASLDISLQGRFAVCESASILLSCMIGVVIEHKGIEYYISHEAYDQVSSVEIMTAVSTLTLYDSLELGDIFMKLESKATIKITMAGTDLAIKLSSISDRLLSTIALPKTEWETFKHDLSGIVTACDTEIAITAVNCSDVVRQDLCNSSFTIPTECEIPQTKDSLSEFISQQSYSNTGFMDFVEQKYLSPLEPNCLKYSGGNGMTASNVSLPSSDFALEMHVKPNQTGGILMTFDTNGDYVVLLNHDLTDQLVLHTAAKNYFTGLQLTVDDWNQISLAWRDASGVMEIYLADAEGVFTVYAAEIPDVFGGPGTLTLGQVTPGLSASISAGDFNGFIDEVRVWSRRHNPSVITENFRITVTDTTSDVSHSWNFNEGTGMSAYEHFSGSAMVPVSVAEAPKWVKSTLDLSQKQEFDIPQMTSSDTQNAEALAAAVDTCSNLIGEFSLNAVSSDMDTLMSVYEALCVQEIVNSNDTEQAAAIMASMADLYTSLTNSTDSPIQGLCNVIESLSSYIGAGGANCTSCNFGNFNEDGVCVCLDSHWGNSCDTICPVTDNGACNSHGVCDTVSGECNCHPRHYSGESTVEDYWKKFISGESLSVDAEYACGICSGDWVGKECAFAKATSTATELLTGMAYGSYLTTFGGMSFVHVSLGTYTLLKTDTVEVQALFIPCIGDNACRTMTELAMTSGTDSVHVQHSADGGNITVIVKEDGDIEYLSYPTEESFGSIQVKWTEHLYIELKSQGSSFVAYDSPLGLITNAQVPSGQVSSNNGLLGNLGDDWVSDIKCPNDNDDLTEEDVTVAYAGECIRKKYMPGNSFIDHEYGSQRLTSGGYSLRLSNNTGFAVENLTVDTGISDISFGFWAKAESSSNKRSTSSFTVLTVDAGIADIVFRVDSGYLVLDWGSTYETGIVFTPNTWQYLALTWANDGLAAVYVITEDTVQSKDPLDGLLHVGSTVDVQSLYMTAPTADMVTVDCIRSWKERKSLSESDTDSKSYCGPTSQTDKTLMLAVPFDEGNGTDISVLIYDTDANAATGTVKATLNGLVVLAPNASDTDTVVWIPSTVPVDNINSPDVLTAYSRSPATNYTGAASGCLQILDAENITEYCETLPSGIRDHFLQMCIREYGHIGADASQDVMLKSLVFYCATAMKVDECNFDGHFYFCDEVEEEDSGFPIWVVGAAAGGLLLLILLVILIIMKKKKNQKEDKEFEEQDEQIRQQYNLLHSKNTNTRFNKSRLSYYDKETSFIDGRQSTSSQRPSAWLDGRDSAMSGRASQATISSQFFESPMMFMDEDRPASRSKSPMSLFGKNKVVSSTPKSITVGPPSKVPDKFKNKQDFTGVKSEGKNTFSAVSKLINKARMELPPESPHPNPSSGSVGGAAAAYNQGPLFTKRDSFSGSNTTSPPMSPTTPLSPSDVNGQFTNPFGSRGSSSSLFGGTSGVTPKPSFGADFPTSLSGATPQPKFGSSDEAADVPMPLRRPPPIPRAPRPSMGGRRESKVDDLDTM